MDYILRESDQVPLFIDANPRLIEPMNAVLSGINLADVLVRISMGQPVADEKPGAREVRTHLLLMGMLSAAAARGRRLDVAAEVLRAMSGRGIYANSQEELLPIQTDLRSVVPLLYALVRLLAVPGSALTLSTGAIASYSLSPAAARQIADSSADF